MPRVAPDNDENYADTLPDVVDAISVDIVHRISLLSFRVVGRTYKSFKEWRLLNPRRNLTRLARKHP